MSADAPILLDTCAALWLGESKFHSEGETVLAAAVRDKTPVLVSPITAWEVGLLVSRGRLNMQIDPARWFEILTTRVASAAMPPVVLIASSFLPNCPLRDPADRIIAATARQFGYRVMTRDRPLLDYAAAGHLHAIPC